MAGPELLGPGRPRHGKDRRADAKVADTDRKVNGAPCQVNGRLLEGKAPASQEGRPRPFQLMAFGLVLLTFFLPGNRETIPILSGSFHSPLPFPSLSISTCLLFFMFWNEA